MPNGGKLRQLYEKRAAKYPEVAAMGYEKFEAQMRDDGNLQKLFADLATKNPHLHDYGFERFKVDMFGPTKKKELAASGAGGQVANVGAAQNAEVGFNQDTQVLVGHAGITNPFPSEWLENPQPEDEQLLADYQELYAADPRELKMEREAVRHALKTAHPDYFVPEEHDFRLRIPSDNELADSPRAEVLARDGREMIARYKQEADLAQRRNALVGSYANRIEAGPELILASDQQQEEVIEDAWNKLGKARTRGLPRKRDWQAAFGSLQHDMLLNQVRATTDVKNDIIKRADSYGGIDAVRERPELRQQVLTEVMNTRLTYGLQSLSPEQRDLYKLQSQRNELQQQLSQPLKPVDRVELADQLQSVEAEIASHRNGLPSLFDPVSGRYVAREESNAELVQRAQDYEQRVNREILAYSNTDVGALVNSWNALQSQLRYVTDQLGDAEVVRLPDGSRASVNAVNKLQRQVQAQGLGWGIPLSGDAADKVKGYRELYLDTRAKFDAANRALLLNQDPGAIEKGLGLSLFGAVSYTHLTLPTTSRV